MCVCVSLSKRLGRVVWWCVTVGSEPMTCMMRGLHLTGGPPCCTEAWSEVSRNLTTKPRDVKVSFLVSIVTIFCALVRERAYFTIITPVCLMVCKGTFWPGWFTQPSKTCASKLCP